MAAVGGKGSGGISSRGSKRAACLLPSGGNSVGSGEYSWTGYEGPVGEPDEAYDEEDEEEVYSERGEPSRGR